MRLTSGAATSSLRASVVALAAMTVSGCEEGSEVSPPEQAQTSPNARIIPAPLLSGKSLVAKAQATTTASRAEPSPSGAPTQTPNVVEAFSLRSAPEPDLRAERLLSGLFLDARFSWPKHDDRPTLHGSSEEETEAVWDRLGFAITVDLRTLDRMEVSLDSDAFPLQRDTSFLARSDRAGHALVWPNRHKYRVLQQGAVRALLREGRADTTPLLAAELQELGKGRRLQRSTTKLALETDHGRVELEQIENPGLGRGGALLCRWLLEFIAAQPSNDVCAADAVPVAAHFEFREHGELRFTVNSLNRKTEDVPTLVPVPPPRSRFVTQGLPLSTRPILDARARTALRRGPPDGPLGTLSARNPSALGGYVVVDRTPIAFIPPLNSANLDGFRQGDYDISAVTWFGEPLRETSNLSLPGRVALGPSAVSADAGAQ